MTDGDPALRIYAENADALAARWAAGYRPEQVLTQVAGLLPDLSQSGNGALSAVLRPDGRAIMSLRQRQNDPPCGLHPVALRCVPLNRCRNVIV